MSMEESISLEETNKIRISLGLKPLTDDGAPANDADQQAQENYARQREEEAKQRESKKLKDRIAKVRNRQELNASLKGATLGDLDGTDNAWKKTDESTLNWLKKSKKRERELAQKRLRDLEEMDKMAQSVQYTERDLTGLKVSHDLDALEDGEAHILTLKDSRILDNEEDELQNIEMAEAQRTAKNQELKIKKRGYTGYDDEEFDELQSGKLAVGQRRSVLSKYDKVLNEGDEEESGFRLGSGTSAQSKAVKQAKAQQDAAASVNKSLLSIDYQKSLLSDDYLKEGDVGFKKPKTKKKRSSRRAPAARDDNDNGNDNDTKMEIDDNSGLTRRERNLDGNFVDDDELQAALARSRMAKLHKRKKLTPEELAEKIAKERQGVVDTSLASASVPPEVKMEEDEPRELEGEGEGGGLVFDDTSEFIRSVGTEPIVAVAARKKAERPATVVVKEEEQEKETRAPVPVTSDGDVAMTEIEVGGDREEGEEYENADEAMALLDSIEAALKEEDADEESGKQGELGIGGTAAEPTFSGGLASTFNVLRDQGILSKTSSDTKDRERTQLQRDLWLADQRRRIAQREMERIQSRGGSSSAHKDQATREYENRLREQQEAREQLEAFKNYKPDVNIVYYDEYGRSLSAKEAWKALSHKFHGKGSGKGKMEKRLKKIAEEKRREAMASGDTPLSMQKAFQIRQEKTGQAHFVLSVGNKGAVPQAAQFLDGQSLSKSKMERNKRKKEAAAAAGSTTASSSVAGDGTFGDGARSSTKGGFLTLQAGGPSMDNGGSASPGGGASGLAPAGFSRIGMVSEEAGGSGSGLGTPTATGKKVAFGFKRKAEDDVVGGTPPPFKR